MDIKNFIAAIAIAASTSLAQADVLFDNGAPAGNAYVCISGPHDCGGSGTWTVYDQFTLTSAATVGGFANWNIINDGDTYSGTNWSIWLSEPTNGGTALYSGKSTAAISIDQGYALTTVDDLSIYLPAGTYWLGINHVLPNNVGGAWTYAFSANGQSDAVQLDGASFGDSNKPDMAFVVTSVPEPTTYAMLMAGLGLIGFAARRKRTAA